ncbi:hypothetical protein PM082_004765 [Marasmius tenuissimus]|nr:hypothetical protein PM082_004765 [Marasmius tenuissimus]
MEKCRQKPNRIVVRYASVLRDRDVHTTTIFESRQRLGRRDLDEETRRLGQLRLWLSVERMSWPPDLSAMRSTENEIWVGDTAIPCHDAAQPSVNLSGSRTKD